MFRSAPWVSYNNNGAAVLHQTAQFLAVPALFVLRVQAKV
jgi:hypothetical protein